MRTSNVLYALPLLGLFACGGGDGSPSEQKQTSSGTPSRTESPSGTSAQGASFDPPAAADGYKRLVSKTVPNVPPGGDVTYCQYVMPPVDHDVDVIDVMGYQSKFGHHAVAFTYTPQPGEMTGSNFKCMGTEFSSGEDSGNLASMGTFLGGAAGADGGKSATTLPDGVAFRMKAGQGIMLNVHYLNTGETPIDGNAVVDVKMVDADPNRQIASMFVNVNGGFDLGPNATTKSSIDCVAQSDLQFIMMSNHMHEYGTTASTQIVHADGSMDDLHVDPTWTFDMQFNPVFSRWDVASPFAVHAGDTIRTSCEWKNTTTDEMKFPREMCVGVGFVLTSGDAKVPLCANGTWFADGL